MHTPTRHLTAIALLSLPLLLLASDALACSAITDYSKVFTGELRPIYHSTLSTNVFSSRGLNLIFTYLIPSMFVLTATADTPIKNGPLAKIPLSIIIALLTYSLTIYLIITDPYPGFTLSPHNHVYSLCRSHVEHTMGYQNTYHFIIQLAGIQLALFYTALLVIVATCWLIIGKLLARVSRSVILRIVLWIFCTPLLVFLLSIPTLLIVDAVAGPWRMEKLFIRIDPSTIKF